MESQTKEKAPGPTMKGSKSEVEHTKLDSLTDSSISLTFDSATDCTFKSEEISSVHTSTSEYISNLSISGSSLGGLKLDQSITFDSGLVSDCFSPTTSESFVVEKSIAAEQLESKTQAKDKYRLEEIFTQDKDGDTILHLAVVEARSDVIFPLIRLAPHPDFLDITNDLYQTSLHLATLTGKSNIVRRLVIAGATLDIQDHNGNTALHIASQRGDVDCVLAMLSPITKPEIEETQYCYQIFVQEHDLSYLIDMRNYDGQSCVHLAASGGFLKVMESLYSNNANIDNQDGKTGRTALHYAIENANLRLVQLLLSKCDANPQIRNYASQTAYRIASSLCKKMPSETRKDILALLKTHTDNSDLSSEWDSDSSSDEVDFESLLQNSRVSAAC